MAALDVDSGVRYGEDDATLIGVPMSGRFDLRALVLAAPTPGPGRCGVGVDATTWPSPRLLLAVRRPTGVLLLLLPLPPHVSPPEAGRPGVDAMAGR